MCLSDLKHFKKIEKKTLQSGNHSSVSYKTDPTLFYSPSWRKSEELKAANSSHVQGLALNFTTSVGYFQGIDKHCFKVGSYCRSTKNSVILFPSVDKVMGLWILYSSCNFLTFWLSHLISLSSEHSSNVFSQWEMRILI